MLKCTCWKTKDGDKKHTEAYATAPPPGYDAPPGATTKQPSSGGGGSGG